MLIRDNFQSQFYDIIKRQHVLLVAGDDVDSLCASLILMKLLDCDCVPYSLVPVSKWGDLEAIFKDHAELNPAVVAINCGGNRALYELEVPGESDVFVCDSRRPFDLDNVYDNKKIRLLVDNEELGDMRIPAVTDIYRDDDDSSDSDEENEEPGGNRMEAVERRILKKEARRRWEEKKNSLLWDYYEFSWHSVPSAVRMFELAAALNRPSAEFLWLAAVGLNSQFADRIPRFLSRRALFRSQWRLTQKCAYVFGRFIHKFARTGESKGDDIMRIRFEKELPLAMYAHWDLYRAMMVNEYFACKTKNWTQKGDHDMKHLLANLGLTLHETKQRYDDLSSERKKEIIAILEKAMDASFASFTSHVGYSCRVNSADVARGIAARLETHRSTALVERFYSARMVLKTTCEGTTDEKPLTNSFHFYKMALESVRRLVVSAINQSEVLPMGTYYLYVCSRHLEDDMFESRHFIFTFQNFLLRAFAAGRKGRGSLPIIVAFPMSGDNEGWHVVSGSMPKNAVYDTIYQKSVIGRAFLRVKATSKTLRIRTDRFDSDLILLKSEDRSRFFDVLQTVLQ